MVVEVTLDEVVKVFQEDFPKEYLIAIQKATIIKQSALIEKLQAANQSIDE